MEELSAWAKRDLSLRIRGHGVLGVVEADANVPFGKLFEMLLLPNRLCYRVEGDEIVVMPLEDLLR